MNQKTKLIIAGLLMTLSYKAVAAEENSLLRCEYQTGYGEASFYLGYEFNLTSKQFENLLTRYVGPMNQTQPNSYSLIESTGNGTINFENGYALLTLSNLENPVPFVLKCNQLDPEAIKIDSRNFEILSEDLIDGEIKPNLEFMNYCGNDNVNLRVDLSKYIEKTSPWYGTLFNLFAERTQFGPSFDCSAGERRRENFKVLNQILNEARANNNLLKGQIRIQKQKFSPSGYAVRLELKSEKLGKSFIFKDSLTAE